MTNQVSLTPVAIRQGHAFADTTYGKKPWVADLDFIPTAIFSTPELGTVGMNEEQASGTLRPWWMSTATASAR